MKFIFILILSLIIASCDYDAKKEIVSDSSKIKYKNNENKLTKNTIPPDLNVTPELYIHCDSIFNYSYIIKFYRGFSWIGPAYINELNAIDTSFYLGIPLKDHINSRYTSNFYKKLIETIPPYENYKERKKNGRFFLKELVPIEKNFVLGVFVENGHESIAYAYCKMELVFDYYYIHGFYHSLDMTGIGGFYFDQIYQIKKGEFYMLGFQKREEYQEVAIHYFTKNFQNYTYKLAECYPHEIVYEKKEKLEYSFNKQTGTVNIKLYRIDFKNEKKWILDNESNFNVLEIRNENQNNPNNSIKEN